jgi:hypothetical protein
VNATDSSSGRPRPHLLHNWLSLAGLVIALGSLFSFLLLLVLDAFDHFANPYIGVLRKTIKANDCNACHTILAQGTGTEPLQLSAEGQPFKHPGGEIDPGFTGADCHTGGP